ncbi:MAG: two-component system chemotaxis response regulator CheB [Alphaproteobacteria bacterium]
MEVVASAGNGQAAIDSLRKNSVDVIVLDIEMPVLDGLSALPKLLEIDPTVKIVMASTLTVANADISLRALAKGAADYVAKPTSTAELHSADDFKRELSAKVIALAGARRRVSVKRERTPAVLKSPGLKAGPFGIRTPSRLPPTILAVGSSTGGPQALMTFIKGLGTDFSLPIVVTQHMPATFTAILAKHLTENSGRKFCEAKDGDRIEPGRGYVAPGDYHMLIVPGAAGLVVKLTDTAPENFCRPSVDPMLRSLIETHGAKALVVILTGMGHDGLEGARGIVDAGGTVIAQDEETSVVWGMPGAVTMAGVCAAVLPLNSLAGRVRQLCGKAGS